jgi:hypothetical protein
MEYSQCSLQTGKPGHIDNISLTCNYLVLQVCYSATLPSYRANNAIPDQSAETMSLKLTSVDLPNLAGRYRPNCFSWCRWFLSVFHTKTLENTYTANLPTQNRKLTASATFRPVNPCQNFVIPRCHEAELPTWFPAIYSWLLAQCQLVRRLMVVWSQCGGYFYHTI